MGKLVARRIIAAFGVTLGITLFFGAIVPMVAYGFSDGIESAMLLAIFPMLTLLMPGIFVIYSGVQLWRKLSLENVKPIIGFTSFLAVFILSAWADKVIEQAIGESVSLFVCALFAMPLYVIAMRFIIGYFFGRKPAIHELVGRGALILLAWLLWFSLSPLFWKGGFWNLEDSFLSLLIPAAISYGAYCLAYAWLVPREEREKMESSRFARRRKIRVSTLADLEK